MSTNHVSPFLIVVIVLVVFPLLAGCEAANSQSIALAAPESGEFDNQAVDEALTGRWQAMADFYADHRNVLGLTGMDASEVSAYRWNALGQFYSTHPLAGVALTSLNAEDISAYRWAAAAKFYAENPLAGIDLRSFSPDECMTYRWNAMAEAYQKVVLTNQE